MAGSKRGSAVYTYDGDAYKEDKWYEERGLVNPKWEQDEGRSWVQEIWDPWRKANGIPIDGSGGDASFSYGEGGTSGGYAGQQAAQAYRRALEEKKRLRREALDNGLQQLNITREEAMRQVYLRGEQQKALMPEQLHNLGLTGGGSETVLQGNLMNHQNAANDIESQYQKGAQELENKFQSGVAMDTAHAEEKIAAVNEKYRQEQFKATQKLADRKYEQEQKRKEKMESLKKQVYLNGAKKNSKTKKVAEVSYDFKPSEKLFTDDYPYEFFI